MSEVAGTLSKIKVPKLGGGNNPPILQFAVLGGGGLLILAAVYNLDPIGALKNLFTGKNPLDAKYQPGAVFPAGAGAGISGVVPDGGSAPLGEKQGTGVWVKADPGTGYSWMHFYTSAEAKTAHISTPAAPGASPPWRWDVGANAWVDQRILTGAANNPARTPVGASTAPSTTSGNSQSIPGQATSSVGGSDPTGISV